MGASEPERLVAWNMGTWEPRRPETGNLAACSLEHGSLRALSMGTWEPRRPETGNLAACSLGALEPGAWEPRNLETGSGASERRSLGAWELVSLGAWSLGTSEPGDWIRSLGASEPGSMGACESWSSEPGNLGDWSLVNGSLGARDSEPRSLEYGSLFRQLITER